jgi:hypothetical protein
MLCGTNDARNAQALGEVPVSAMTLTDFSPQQLRPPSIRAPRTSMPTLWNKFTVGPASPTPATTGGILDQQQQRQTLNQQPLTESIPKAVRDRIEKFSEALTEAIELSATMVAAEEGDPLDYQTVAYALQILLPLIMSLNFPTPLILPLQSGGIGAEWHTSGMNIELRFRKPYDIYAVLEDARGVVLSFHSRDPNLVYARAALRELSNRSIE